MILPGSYNTFRLAVHALVESEDGRKLLEDLAIQVVRDVRLEEKDTEPPKD